MNRLYRYHVNCGRMGNLDGLFAVDDHGEACLRALIESRRDIYFGEVLGKHSDVVQVLDASEIGLVEATPDEIATVLRILGLGGAETVAVISGFCPLRCSGSYSAEDEGLDLLAWARGEEPS